MRYCMYHYTYFSVTYPNLNTLDFDAVYYIHDRLDENSMGLRLYFC